MTLTKKTLSSWESIEARTNAAIQEVLGPWIVQAFNDNKTNGVSDHVDDTHTYRYWADEKTAQEYIDLAVATAKEHGYTVTFTIEDYAG